MKKLGFFVFAVVVLAVILYLTFIIAVVKIIIGAILFVVAAILLTVIYYKIKHKLE